MEMYENYTHFNEYVLRSSYDLFLSHVIISLLTKTGLLLDITFQWLMNRLFSQQGNYHMTQKELLCYFSKCNSSFRDILINRTLIEI